MKKGFTLAEVLITLGIVGVVAVLTVPSVMKNYRNRLYVTQFQKAYAQLSEAVVSFMADENVDKLGESSIFDNPKEFLQGYIKTSGSSSGFSDQYISPAYSSFAGSSSSNVKQSAINGCIRTVERATICSAVGTVPNNEKIKRIVFVIDVNGTSEPNTGGRDMFVVCADADGAGDIKDTKNSRTEAEPITNLYGQGFLSILQRNGWEMNY